VWPESETSHWKIPTSITPGDDSFKLIYSVPAKPWSVDVKGLGRADAKRVRILGKMIDLLGPEKLTVEDIFSVEDIGLIEAWSSGRSDPSDPPVASGV
jgi:hypothetical protein